MNRKSLFRGLAAIFSLLFIVLITMSVVMYNNYGMIDTFFGAERTKTVNKDGESVDSMYYKSEFADSMADITSKAKTLKMEQAVAQVQVKSVEEGVVLLKNENDALPLAKNTPVTLFGNAACGMEDGHNHLHLSKKKDVSSLDGIPTVWFDDAMEAQFKVNRAVIDNAYSSAEMWHAGTNANRCSCWQQTPKEGNVEDVIKQAASWADGTDYKGGVAVVNFFRWASEGREAYLYQDPTNTPGAAGSNDETSARRMLSLSKNEEDLLLYLKAQKDAGSFSKIIVCLSSDLGMELGYVNDPAYGIDAFIKVGIPGNVGYTGLANVMAGEAVPSGHFVDTYTENCFSSPSTVGASYLSPSWSNWNNGQANDVLKLSSDAAKDGAAADSNKYYTIYGAGIYLGYKYFETRYADAIAGDMGARSAVGSTGGGTWNYADEVAYPFGYGLSYTTFTQTLGSVKYDSEKDGYTVPVTVTNTGKYAGRSVIQVYAQTPYGVYEKENGVEKSAVQLAGFAKTDVLAKGESVTVDVTVDRYLLASYDANIEKGYILSAGEYYLAVGDNAHDAINNILAKQGGKGMTDERGNAAEGDASKVYAWEQPEIDTTSYNLSVYGTGVEVTNRFEHVDINSYEGQSYAYLSRKDWEGTYPTQAKIDGVELTAEMANDMDCDWYANEDHSSDWYLDTQGAHKKVGISDFKQATSHAADNSDVVTKFIQMRGIDVSETQKWSDFLDQFTVAELVSLYPDNNGYAGVPAISIPSSTRGDDGTCVLQAHLKAYDTDGLAWPSQVVISCTWNVDRYADHGRMVAEQAIFSDCEEIWWGGGNMHQVPWGGRNMQYYSEDAVLAYYEGAAEANALQSKGVIYSIKHMALNDTEAHRESTATFCSEQAVREIYLRSFEGTFMKGGGLGCMMGFNRMGLAYCATDYNLMTKVVRGEWGWKGHFTTDADSGAAFKDHYLEQLIAGIDYTCWEQVAGPAAITAAINGGDGYVLQQMRRAAMYTLYTDLRSISVNGLTESTVILPVTPAWQIGVITADIVVGVGAVAFVVLFALFAYVLKESESKKRRV